MNSQLATSTAYIFGVKHAIDNRSSSWQLQGVSYIVSKNGMNFGNLTKLWQTMNSKSR